MSAGNGTLDPLVTLTAYWRWERHVRPAPQHLALVLDAVRQWVLEAPPADWTPVRSVLTAELRPMREETHGQPRWALLLDACLQLDDLSQSIDNKPLSGLQMALIQRFIHLPHGIARQIWETAPARLERDELVAIANEALVTAARRWPEYCAARGFDPVAPYFQWYATQRCRGAIYDALRAADWVTRTQRGNARALLAAGQESGVPVPELAARTGLSQQTVLATQRVLAQAPVSLEDQVADIASVGHTVESHLMADQLLDACTRAVRQLSLDAQSVLVLRYFTGQTLDDIATTLSLPKTTVSELHIEAVLAVHAAMLACAHDSTE